MISWVDAFLILTKWQEDSSDIAIMPAETREVRGESATFASGGTGIIQGVDSISGTVRFGLQSSLTHFSHIIEVCENPPRRQASAGCRFGGFPYIG